MKKVFTLLIALLLATASSWAQWQPSDVCIYSTAYSVIGTAPRDNRGLAISNDGQYLYLGYNNPSPDFRRILLSDGSTSGGNTTDRAKSIAVDDQGRVYQTGPDGNPIKIYNSDLTTLQLSIPMSKCEGIAVRRESGTLYLYATDRTGNTVSRFQLTESGGAITGATLNGLDGAGVVSIAGANNIRGITVDPDGKIYVAQPSPGKVYKMNADGSGQVSYTYNVTTDNPYYFAFIGEQLFVTHGNYNGGTRVAVLKYSDMSLVGNIVIPFATLGYKTTDNADMISGIAAMPDNKGFYVTYENGSAADDSYKEPVIKVSFPAPPAPITNIGTSSSSACGILDVQVTVKDFKNIGAISAVLNFDPTKLQLLPIVAPPFAGVTLNPALATAAPSGNNTIGQFRLGDFPDPAITLGENAVLFTLHFNVLPAAVGGTTTPLTWSTVSQECEYAGSGGSPTYVSTFNNGFATIPERPVVNTTLGLAYCTIQEAINAATAGNTITVAAGTYAEDIVVNKSLTILGPKAAVSGCDASRGTGEAIIVPKTAAIATGKIFQVTASNVTIKGFTIDGDNTALTSGFTSTNGADIDAAKGILVGVDNINNLIVTNNIFQNLSYYGVELFGASYSAPATTGHVISFNKFQNLGTYDASSGIASWGGGVLLYNGQYAAVNNNCMTNVRIGIQTGNFHALNPGAAMYQVIDNNTIQARRRGIFYNLHTGNPSPITLSNNNITALAHANETAWWDGILMSSLSDAIGNATNNSIDGSGITAIPTKGIEVWNCQAAPLISSGTITGVGLGINVNNFESYPTAGSNAGNTSATIDGVAISGTTIAGIKVHDNPSNTNGATVSAEIKNVTISGTNATGIWVTGPDASANIHDNTISASVAGINVDGTVTSATSALTIATNSVTLTSQLAGSNPTVGIALNKVSGTAAATVSGNTVTNPFYGYTVYALSTSPVTTITGGTVKRIMVGVAAGNWNGTVRAPSTLGVSSIAISDFAGTGSFQAGVYVFTGGAVANTSITATVDKVSVTGTGKTQQDAAGLSFADFSTLATAGQNITVTECTITDNKNRGINIRGANANVTVLRSTLTGNGADAFGTGDNNGYGIVAFAGALATVENCFITNPATSATEVSALFTFPYGSPALGGTINATNNSLDRNGNGWLANNAGGTLTATCNWLGSTVPATNAAAVSGTVTYNPWLCSGTDTDLATAGFQGVPCNSGAPEVPANGFATVQCLSAAIPPTFDPVYDVDGTTPLLPVLVSTVDSPLPFICEGTRTYTYSYTNCSGISALWSFVYTIDHITAPVLPAAGGSVVECISAITTPTPPTGIVDVCGAPVSAVAAVPAYVDAPDPITCQGTRTYSFTYTDCAGLVSTWNYVYTIQHLTAPAEVGGPVANASTVECESAALPLTSGFPVVEDVCGNTLTPGAPVKNSVYVNKFDEAVTLSSTQAAGVWYTDRYAPAGFAQDVFNGNSLKHSISAADGASSRPSSYSSAFYNTQGRKYDLGASTDAIEVKLYIPSDWATSGKRMAGLWGTAFNAANSVSGYPIIEFTSDGGVPRFRAWEANSTWVDMGLPAGFTYNNWVTLKIKLLSNGQFLVSAGSLNYVTKKFSATSVKLANVILQGYNYDPVLGSIDNGTGVTYDIYWDDFTWNDAYTPITCEGAVSYTYNYADCAGLQYAWTYTYTIDRTTPPAQVGGPVSTSSTVYSIAAAVPPTLPVVNDVCGTPLAAPVPVIVDAIVNCVGTRTYTYTYTDCVGLTYVWVYTYTLATSTISGTLVYNNTAKTPMNKVKMVIKQAGVQVGAEVTTDGSGAFSFPNLCAGTYTIHVTFNEKDAGGINATDAAQVNAWSANFGYIEHVKFLAGDVTFNKTITSADALKIQGYFVFPGNATYVITPKWSYWKKGELIKNNEEPYDINDNLPAPWPTDITITVAGNVPNLELYGMLTGDFDGSLVPTILKSADPSLTLAENSNLQIGANQVFELPLRASSAMQVSAVSMILDVPSDLATVKNVKINGSNDPVMWSINGNELRIGWYSINPVNVAENGALVTLELMTTSAFAQGRSLDIALPFNPLNELADGNYEAIERAELMVAKVGNQTVGNISVDKNGGLLFSNYPNPFSKVTTLEYSLPVDGKVNLSLYNNLGQLVSVLVDAEQLAGQHKFRYESNTLQPGIYVAKLRLVNNETDMVGTIKLSVQK